MLDRWERSMLQDLLAPYLGPRTMRRVGLCSKNMNHALSPSHLSRESLSRLASKVTGLSEEVVRGFQPRWLLQKQLHPRFYDSLVVRGERMHVLRGHTRDCRPFVVVSKVNNYRLLLSPEDVSLREEGATGPTRATPRTAWKRVLLSVALELVVVDLDFSLLDFSLLDPGLLGSLTHLDLTDAHNIQRSHVGRRRACLHLGASALAMATVVLGFGLWVTG